MAKYVYEIVDHYGYTLPKDVTNGQRVRSYKAAAKLLTKPGEGFMVIRYGTMPNGEILNTLDGNPMYVGDDGYIYEEGPSIGCML